MSSMALVAKYKFIELSMIYSTKQSQRENDSISRVHAKVLIGICLHQLWFYCCSLHHVGFTNSSTVTYLVQNVTKKIKVFLNDENWLAFCNIMHTERSSS